MPSNKLGSDSPPGKEPSEHDEYSEVCQAVRDDWIDTDEDGVPTWTVRRTGSGVVDFPPYADELLRPSAAKVAALRETGLDVVPVPRAIALEARRLAVVLEIVAESPEATIEHIEAAAHAVEAWRRRGMQAAPWQRALANIMALEVLYQDATIRWLEVRARHEKLSRGFRDVERAGIASRAEKLSGELRNLQAPKHERLAVEAARSRAVRILKQLAERATERPAAFRSPTEDNLAAATVFLATTRIDTRPRRKPKGAISPWGGAVRFSECFGVAMGSRRHGDRERIG